MLSSPPLHEVRINLTSSLVLVKVQRPLRSVRCCACGRVSWIYIALVG